MKRAILFSILLISFTVKAQDTIFYESFEPPSYADSVTSSQTSSVNDWGISSFLYNSGSYSDTCQVKSADTTWLETDTIHLQGSLVAYLRFSHICKIAWDDAAEIFVSTNNGNTWTQVTGPQYQGIGQFGNQGNKFSSTSYVLDWDPANNTTIPTNSWWKTEDFDISSLISGASHVKLRFMLRDGGTPGNGGSYGWAMDDIVLWIPSQQEASAVGIHLPLALPSGCGLSNETIQILIANNGGGAISGNLTASFQRDNGPVTTESVGQTIMPGDTGTFTFNGTINLSTTQDTTYLIRAWVNLTNDPNQTNDTLTDSLESRVALYDPIINDTTIPYGTSVTLHAVHIDSISWYTDPLAQNLLQQGAYYTTPVLFDTSIYYVQAGITGTGGNIAPMSTVTASTCNTGPCSALNNLNYGTCGTQEMWISTSGPPDLTPGVNWIEWNWTTAQTFDIMVIHHAQDNARFLTGFTLQIWSGSTWVTQFTISSLPMQCINSIQFPFALNTSRFRITSFQMTGTGQNSNPNFREIEIFEVLQTGCPSAVKPVKVMISGIPHQDAGVEAITEPSGLVNSGVPLDVKVKIKNHGIDTITKVSIGWTVDGIPKTSYNWTGTLPNDSITAPFTIGQETFTTGVHKIKAWTSMPNDSVDWANHNDTALSNVFVCLEDTLTIGGSNPDFATIQDALDILDSVGVCGHTVFNIAPGTYTGQLTINPIMGASDSSTITFRSATGVNTDVIIQFGASGTTNNWVVRFNGADYFTFSELTIKATNASYATVVEMINGATYNTIQGCLIQSTGTSSYNRGIYDYNTLNHYNTYKNNEITGGYYGMYIYGVGSTSWQKGTVIKGNDISGFYYYGILCYYQDSTQIIGNYIHDGTYSYNYGIYAYYNFNGFNISGNNISLSAPSYSYGLRVYYCNYYSYAGNSAAGLVSNNFISITGGSSTNYGIYAYYSNNVIFINNSIHISAGSTSSRALYQYNTSSNTTGQTFLNNIFANSSGGYAAYFGQPTYLNNSDYNCFYSSGSYLAYWSGNHATLASLQAASYKDSNSVSVIPGFSSVTDLHVNNALLDGAGAPSPLVTIDIDGQLRDTITPDIGADEFKMLGDDAGVVSFAPTGICPGTNLIYAGVKNFGLDTLFTCTIKWEVNGVMQDSVILNDTLTNLQANMIPLDTFNFNSSTTYNITFWTEYPNNIADSNTSNDTLYVTGLKTALPPGTYTIGPDSTDDYNSFGAAVNDLNAYGICGPVVFEVDSGTYLEQIEMFEVTGASSVNTITFESASGISTDATIQYAATSSTDNWVVRLNGADWITFKNLTIKSTAATYATVFEVINGADHNIVEGCILNAGTTTSSYARCIYDYSTINQFNTYKNNKLLGGYYGIYTYGSGTTSWQKGTVIKGNEISGFYYYGIIAYYQDSIQIIGNYIHDGTYQYNYGIYAYYNFNGFKIDKNNISLNATSYSYGMRVYYCNYYSYAGTSAAGMVSNNFISIYGGSSTNYGIYAYYSNNVGYFNNSIHISSGNTSSRGLYQYNTASNTTGQTFINNIFSNTGGGYAAYYGQPSYVNTVDYNCYYTSGSYLAYWSGNHANLASLQSSSGKDSHSISLDPGFFSATDLHTNNFNLWGTGIPVPGVIDDFDGDLRDTVAPCIGADEFMVLANDAGIIALIHPVAPCPGVTSDIIVELKNYGTDTLFSATIHWTFNGTLQDTLAFTDTIIPGGSTNIVLDTATFYFGTLYNLIFWTTDPNGIIDSNSSNDTLFATGIKTALNTGTYSIGGTGADYPSFNAALNDLIAYGICGPVVFEADSGSYTEQLDIPNILGTSAVNTVTFTSATGDSTDVVLNYTSTSSSVNFVVRFNGSSFIRFTNMTIHSNSTSYPGLVELQNGASYNEVSHCVLESAQNSTSYARGVYNYGPSNRGNYFNNNRILNCYYGVYAYGGGTTSLQESNIYEGNEITGYYYYGMYLYYQDSVIVTGNYIKNGTSSIAYPRGIYAYYCDNGREITKNIIDLSGSSYNYGIYSYYNDGTSTEPGLLANNFIIINGGTSTNYGIYCYNNNYQNFYYNSINMTAGNTSSRILYVSSGSNIKLLNNIFVNTGGGYAYYISTTSAVTQSDYNDLYVTGSYLAYWSGNHSSLSSLQSSSNQEAHSVSVDPGFYSANDLHCIATGTNNKGIPIPVVLDDIDGQVRDTLTPDMGADEFIPTGKNAAAIVFLGPDEGCGLGMDTVFMKIFNAGGDTITDSLNASYQVLGSTTIVTEAVTDTIIPGDTIIYKFNTLINLATTVDTTYELIGWVDLTGDPINNNDSTATSVFSGVPSAPPLVSDTTISYATSVTLTAVSNDSVIWYAFPTGDSVLGTGYNYTTPILYDTTTYWVVATSGGLSSGGNIAPSSTVTASTCNTGPCSTLNDLNYGICGSQSMWISTSSPPSLTPGVNWIEWNWSTPQVFDIMVIHHAQDNARFLTGFTLQTWSGSAWVTEFTISNLPMQCINSIQFPMVLNTNRFRITSFQMTGTGQTSNPNFREIEIFEAIQTGCPSTRVPLTVSVIGIPPYDPGITEIMVNDGCALSTSEPVTIGITNIGTDTLASGLTATYSVNGGAYVTPENVSLAVAPYDTVYYTFTATANMASPNADSLFDFKAFVSLTTDPNHLNDTMVLDSVISLQTPLPPTVVSPVFVPYASPATLNATAASIQDSLYWYEFPVGGNDIGTGSTYITPILYDTTIYYVEAVAGGVGGTYILGTGITTNTNTTYPAPYGNWYWGSKEQYLILASELTALGVSAGPITSLAFNVATIQGTALQNLEFKMGHTNVSSLSTWISNLTSVYTASSYTETLGWNTHQFSSPFIWNGTDNIVIESCFNNSSYTYNAIVYQTSTTFTSTINYHSDAAGVCTSTSSPTGYQQRPNMQLIAAGGNCPSVRVPIVVNTGSPPPIDAGVYSMISPLSATQSGQATPVTVDIKNYGLNTLTSFTINWELDGVTQTPYSWSGSLLQDSISNPVTIATDTFTGGWHCIKVWTSMPNNVADTSNFNDTIVFCFSACLNGTYTLGTSSSDFPSFADAILALDSIGVCGHVIFDVAPGTYSQQLVFHEFIGIDSNNTVTFRGATGDSTDAVIIYAASSSSLNYTIQLDGADYLRFKSLTFKSAGTTYPTVVDIRNSASHNEFSNCVIECATNTTSNARGIYDYSGLDDYNVYRNNLIISGYYGMYIYGSSSASLQKGTVIEGNIIRDFYYYGTLIYYQDSVRFEGNSVENAVNSGSVYGTRFYYCDHIEVVRNMINLHATSTHYGMYIYYCDGTSADHNLIANNFISLNGTGTGTWYGCYIYNTTYLDFVYNSVNLTGGSTTSARCVYQSSGSNQKYINNIFVNSGGGYTYYVSTPTAIITSDYNDFYTTGTYLAYWSGNRADLTALKTASSKDAHSISVDPGFISAAELHVNSIDLNAAGTPFSGVSDDIDGEPRHATTPDIGADEFTPSPNDAGIISVDYPITPALAGSLPVKVTIRNFGVDTLNSATINWSVNNVLQTPYSWSGTLLTGQQQDTLTIGNYTFTAGQACIKAWTSNPNSVPDGFNFNDTTESCIIVCTGMMNGTYTIGGSSPDFTSFTAALQGLISCGISGAVTFNVAPGAYNEQLTIASIPGTSATNTVTFQGTTGDSTDVILSYGASSTTDNWVVLLNGVDFLTFKHMTIASTTTSSYARVVVFDNGADNNTITNCEIVSVAISSSYATPIYSYNTSTPCDYNIIKYNRLLNGYYSVYFRGASSTNLAINNIFEGNIIQGFYYYGLYFYYHDAVQIRSNEIQNGSSSGSVYGMYLGYCDNDIAVVKNKINLNGSGYNYGMRVYYCDGTSIKKGLIANNFIAITSSSTSSHYAMYQYYSNWQDFIYNSINIQNGSSSYAWYSYYGGNLRFINNNICNMGGGYTFYVNSSTAVAYSDYNNLYTTGSNLAYWSGAATNLAMLQLLSYKDSNSVSVDPGFSTMADLHVVTSALNGLAMPVIQIADDIDDQLRDTLAPDIGADEFTPLNLDLAAVYFTEPSDGYDAVGSLKDVKLAIRNQGIDTVANFAVGYIIPGSMPIIETYSDTLFPGELDTFAFSTQMSPIAGQFNMCGFTGLLTDQNHTNDTTCMTYTGLPVLQIPYFDDFEGTNYWFSAGGMNDWEFGIPSATTINSAHSPSHVWTTNLSGYYSNNSNGYLYTPKFDLSTYGKDSLKFWHYVDCENPNDGGNIQYFNIQGNWVTLGSQNDPNATNWYNTFNNGQFRWSGQTSGWILCTYNLNAINDFGSITQFRFAFSSNNSSNSYDGWAIDDFELTLPKIPEDAGVISIISPPSTTILGAPIQVQVEIKNFGTDTLTSIPISYTVNNSIPHTENWTGTLLPNITATYTFTTGYTGLTIQNYDFCAYTSLPNDVYYFNDSTCKAITTQLPPFDAGISEILNPGDTTYVDNDYQVTVRIHNFGINTLTSIPVAYRFKTTSPVEETWTGSLSPGDSVDYTFLQSYNSTLLIGNYELCAYSRLTSDGYHLNDTTCDNKLNIIGIEEFDYSGMWLGQNIPNPSNGMTLIDYAIPHSG
ncbi:right-handed parallel beta-helix repeat-containing protein, partial [candidate division KSB1 bacterium]